MVADKFTDVSVFVDVCRGVYCMYLYKSQACINTWALKCTPGKKATYLNGSGKMAHLNTWSKIIYR